MMIKLLRRLGFLKAPIKPAHPIQDTITAEQIEHPEIKDEVYYDNLADTEAVAEMDSKELTTLFKHIKARLPHIDERSLEHHVAVVSFGGQVRVVWQARDQKGKRYIGLIADCLRRYVEYKKDTTVKLLEVK